MTQDRCRVGWAVLMVAVVAVLLTPVQTSSAAIVASGSTIWTARFRGPTGDNGANAEVVSPDGTRVFVTGSSLGIKSGGEDFQTIAYNASTGARLWKARYPQSGLGTSAFAIAVSPDASKVFVSGTSQSPATGWDYTTLAYAASTGERLWVRRYKNPGDDIARAIAVSPDSSMVVITGDAQATTIAYASSNGPPYGDADTRVG